MLLTIFFVICIVVIFLWSFAAKRARGIPAPHWVPFFGTLLTASKHLDRIHDYHMDNCKAMKYKAYAIGFPGGVKTLMVSQDERVMRHILKDKFDNYVMPIDRLEVLGELFGNGIFGTKTNGVEWSSQRKAAATIFTLRQLRDYMTTACLEHGTKVVNLLQQAAESGEVVNIQDMYFRHTMDSFSDIAFSEKLGCLDSKEVHPFAKAFDEGQKLLTIRFFDPLWKLKRMLNVGREKQVADYMNTLDKYAAIWIQRRRQDLNESARRSDLITQFMAAAAKENTTLTDKQLRDIIINFLVAGRDTTACALSWFTYEMSLHPDIQQKVYDEIVSVLKGRDPDYEAAHQLAFTEACLLETLRLHPSVPADSRQAVNEDVLPDGTPVEAGTICMYPIYAWGRSTHLWGQDALEFKPSRWIEEVKDNGDDDSMSAANAGILTKKHSMYKFISFNAGYRLCLGRGLAILEAKLLIAQLFSRFSFEVMNPEKVTYVLSVLLMIKDGLFVKVKPRK